MDQYAIQKFAECLEVIPKTLGENAGVNFTEVISKLYAAHQAGEKNAGFDIEVRYQSMLTVAEVLYLSALLCCSTYCVILTTFFIK